VGENGDDLTEDESNKNLFHSAKSMITTCLKAMGAGSYQCYHGGKGSYRVEKSTLMRYKISRLNQEKPIMFYDVLEYIASKFKSKKVEGSIETDDKVVMVAYENENYVILGEDKDFRGQPIKFFDVNNPDEGIIDGDCFGELVWIEDKKKVSGFGRLFLYWQMLSGDSTDDYKTNCFSEVRWAAKSAYDALVDCQDDSEAWTALVKSMKILYPTPIHVEGWRCENGDTIEIDWLYVLNEMFVMARMLRFTGDEDTTMQEWMEELELNPEEILV
jgi:hypothetical protein